MKNLQSKLALLKRASSQKLQGTRREAPTSEFESKLCSTLGGNLESTESGDLFIVREHTSLRSKYGRVSLENCLSLPVRRLCGLYQGLDHFDMSKALFFDTETTGLAGGSGTYAFLVGIGFFQGEDFVIEQLLMRDHSDEPALLSHLTRRLQGKSSLVSFNGRSFDAQLLATRYSMHRRSEPFSALSHLDLLHLSRRLWGFSPLPDCRLETLETRVLGAPRHQDVPGWMIPDLFFDFLRDRNPAPLKGVVEHNRRDILAMVALCSHMKKLLQEDATPSDPHISLGLGRLWAALDNHELSDLHFRAALTHPELAEQAREKGLIYWARELKKRRLNDKAALLWRRTLTHYPGNLEATVELAKFLEHQRRDYRSALILVEGGLRDRTLTSVRRRALQHRADRLRRRLG